MARPTPAIEHLFRRAGFGLSAADRDRLEQGVTPSGRGVPQGGYREIVDSLLVFDPASTDIDHLRDSPGTVTITPGTVYSPNTDANQARQRWLFRMVHSPAPLQERMALIWHHHFATAHSKIAGIYNSQNATRLMDAKPTEDPAGQEGQIQLFRRMGLGKFRELLVAVAKDPAMLVWLDGYLNTNTRPQENFGRELMELFTFGVEHYTEPDVYAAARVFSGWNLRIAGSVGNYTAAFTFSYEAGRHDTGEKTFSFPIYSSRVSSAVSRIPARSAGSGMQDGLDLIQALAFHPETARRLARRFWTWFVSETRPPTDRFVNDVSRVYLQNDTSIRAVLRAVLLSPEFEDESSHYQRYAWPVELVVRSLKEVGYVGFSVINALTPLVNMGQQLYEPPDVNGWELGAAWFSTGGMLQRMNFASDLATAQRVALREAARVASSSPETLVDFVRGRLSLPPPDGPIMAALVNYVRSSGNWTGSDAQLLTKSAGLFHLMTGSGEYQLI
jgi:uncharacterized protein (DUF1800 family)